LFSLIELSSSYYSFFFKENFLFFISILSSLTLFPIHNEKKTSKKLKKEKKTHTALSTKEGRIEEEEKVFFFL
jgi:hypothetical protein